VGAVVVVTVVVVAVVVTGAVEVVVEVVAGAVVVDVDVVEVVGGVAGASAGEGVSEGARASPLGAVNSGVVVVVTVVSVVVVSLGATLSFASTGSDKIWKKPTRKSRRRKPIGKTSQCYSNIIEKTPGCATAANLAECAGI
jgi:hypothetical protein